jgi:hypothetical protein
MPSKKKRFVVVCTEKRGVFGGYCSDTAADPLTLTDASMCIYWSEDVRGVVGLAATGPTKQCRITKPAPTMILHGITAVFDGTTEAADAWRSHPWG